MSVHSNSILTKVGKLARDDWDMARIDKIAERVGLQWALGAGFIHETDLAIDKHGQPEEDEDFGMPMFTITIPF